MKILKFSALLATLLVMGSHVSRAQDPSGTLVYSLPVTVLRLEVKVENAQFHAGPYAKYAKKYLGIDVPQNDMTTHQVTDITLSPYIEADQTARYTITPGKDGQSFLSMCSQGLVCLGADVPGSTQWRFPAQVKADFSGKGVNSNLTSESATLYRGVKSGSSFNRAAVQQEMIVEKAPETRAKEAAEMIFTLRNSKIQILTGDTDATYSGEAMGSAIEEISNLEKEYMSLFCGYSDISTQTMEFDVVPQADNKSQHYVAFRISDADGLVPADNISGKPYFLELVVQPVSIPSDAASSSSKGAIAHYRVPATCSVRLSDGVKVLMQSRVPVYQLGIESTFPISGK